MTRKPEDIIARGKAALEAAIDLVEDATEDAACALVKARQSETGSLSEVKQALGFLREFCVFLVQERVRFEKLAKPATDGAVLDLAAAREEIGRRLDLILRSRNSLDPA